ncbi:NrtR DNA-binding winged helix domain-containing protein [Mangrovibacterium marinum]|uniref:8-oxo-dGTP diphosphatase n=1 Tax=Mangrovibacterium marinum TaxID=1639118 RepID=A0A2T5C5S5_9BACT|nr:NUDIX hydrolase [Mangrovibacterium marinum]PTN10267.1 8-oxo-dGTP diphosphatase [Mangrovibacterium marinum]
MILKSISVDCVIFGFDNQSLKVLLSRQNPEVILNQINQQESWEEVKHLFENHPSFSNNPSWNVIGAHIPSTTDLDAFAREIVENATGMNDVYLQQFHCFGQVNRVPNHRVITIGYYALINPTHHLIRKSVAVKALEWFDPTALPPLAFDHAEIVQKALESLRQEVQYRPIGFHLLPEQFTLTEFQSLYEVILGKKMDTRNFRKKIANMNLLIDTGEKQKNVSHRAAKLYRFDMDVYEQLKREGLKFRIE